jgi:hypothetical protein
VVLAAVATDVRHLDAERDTAVSHGQSDQMGL